MDLQSSSVCQDIFSGIFTVKFTDDLIKIIFLHSYLKTNQALEFCITVLTMRGIWGVCHPGIVRVTR